VLPAPHLQIEDGWQRVRVNLHAPNAESFWVAPIETVSESRVASSAFIRVRRFLRCGGRILRCKLPSPPACSGAWNPSNRTFSRATILMSSNGATPCHLEGAPGVYPDLVGAPRKISMDKSCTILMLRSFGDPHRIASE